MNTRHHFIRTRGIALITGMVLLLLMSLLAAAGLKDALLEARISRNYTEMELLFQQTESALRYAESNLLPDSIPNAVTSSGEESLSQTVPFNSLASSPTREDLFEPSVINISLLPLPGSKVRGNGPQNRHASLQYFRITALTKRTDSEQGIQIMSTVSRGTQ
jgi:hypothetical protein